MAITPLTGTGASLTPPLPTRNALSGATLAGIDATFSGIPTDAPVVSTTPQQAYAASTHEAAQQLAQQSAALQTASLSIGDQLALVSQAQHLVEQAQQSPDSDTVARVNQQLSEIAGKLEQSNAGATFGNTALLNGNFVVSVVQSGNDPVTLPLPDLSTGALFGDTKLDVSTPQQADASAFVLAQAASKLSDAQAQTQIFISTAMEPALAEAASAQFNAAAAGSTLTEQDLAGGLTQFAPAALSQAQGSIPADMLASLLQG